MLTHDKSSHGLWPGELKINKNVFNFILYSHSQNFSNTGARDPDRIATLSLSPFNVMK